MENKDTLETLFIPSFSLCFTLNKDEINKVKNLMLNYFAKYPLQDRVDDHSAL